MEINTKMNIIDAVDTLEICGIEDCKTWMPYDFMTTDDEWLITIAAIDNKYSLKTYLAKINAETSCIIISSCRRIVPKQIKKKLLNTLYGNKIIDI